MNNPIILWLAGHLGWDPGIVIMLTAVVIGLFLMFLVVFLIECLPGIIARQYREATGIARIVFWILLVIAVVVSFILYTAVAIAAVIGVIYMANQARSWWHKGL